VIFVFMSGRLVAAGSVIVPRASGGKGELVGAERGSE
jgi:hypothetical protein